MRGSTCDETYCSDVSVMAYSTVAIILHLFLGSEAICNLRGMRRFQLIKTVVFSFSIKG
jgi:hypothetical protein